MMGMTNVRGASDLCDDAFGLRILYHISSNKAWARLQRIEP
jgi:hypothetical protein